MEGGNDSDAVGIVKDLSRSRKNPSMRELKALLRKHGVAHDWCLTKDDLVEAVSDMKSKEKEENSLPRQCRICLDDNCPEDLFSPCRCSGTSAFVHRSCLDRWRANSETAFTTCGVCQHRYTTREVQQDAGTRAKVLRRFRVQVLMDLALMLGMLLGSTYGLTYVMTHVLGPPHVVKFYLRELGFRYSFACGFVINLTLVVALVGLAGALLMAAGRLQLIQHRLRGWGEAVHQRLRCGCMVCGPGILYAWVLLLVAVVLGIAILYAVGLMLVQHLTSQRRDYSWRQAKTSRIVVMPYKHR
jgi:hypothetical protein